MDRRLAAWRRTHPVLIRETPSIQEAERVSQVMQEGQASEFWLHLKPQIEALADHAAAQFVETMAKDYATYCAWHGALHAQLAILRLPEKLIAEAERLKAASIQKEA